MSDNQIHEQRRFAIDGITIQSLWLTGNINFLSFIVCN